MLGTVETAILPPSNKDLLDPACMADCDILSTDCTTLQGAFGMAFAAVPPLKQEEKRMEEEKGQGLNLVRCG